MATLSPAIIFYPDPRWSINISPFIQAIGVKDEDQSAVAAGGEISMKQQWNQTYYTGEYVVYTDNRANVDVYSYKEKAAGIFLGVNWMKALWSEIGYEFSSGDSFRAIGEVSTTQVGRGKSRRYSQAYNEYLINEPVDRKTISVNMGYQFSRHLFSFINYAYATYKGDTGTSKSHAAAVGAGYKF
jgi:predicted porin